MFKIIQEIKKKKCIPNTRKHSQGHFQGGYQIPENEIVF